MGTSWPVAEGEASSRPPRRRAATATGVGVVIRRSSGGQAELLREVAFFAGVFFAVVFVAAVFVPVVLVVVVFFAVDFFAADFFAGWFDLAVDFFGEAASFFVVVVDFLPVGCLGVARDGRG